MPVPTTGVLPFNGDENAAQILVEIPALATVGFASCVMATVEIEAGQIPLLIVHWNTFVPTPNPVTPLLGLPGEVMAPTPEIKLQLPVPTSGLLPLKFVAVVAHILKLVPALATVGKSNIVMLTVEFDTGQTPLLMLHWKTLVPVPSAVTPLVGLLGVVMVPKPDSSVQLPSPITGVLPEKFVDVVAHKLKLVPALATVGLAKLVMLTVELLGGHTPLLMVHSNTLVPVPNAVTPLIGLVGVVMVPPPETNVHNPVPTNGVLPDKLVAVVAHKLKLVPALAIVGAK
jgi:hypothetical protein